MVVAAEWGLGEVLLSMFWFFLFFMWIMLLFRIFADIFRSRDLGGFAKTLWLIFVIVTPFLGVFVYLIARGNKMHENDVAAFQAQDAAMREYIQSAAGSTGGTADELAKLASLKEQGHISDAEYEAAKAKILAG